jgi:hypothetical protein
MKQLLEKKRARLADMSLEGLECGLMVNPPALFPYNALVSRTRLVADKRGPLAVL